MHQTHADKFQENLGFRKPGQKLNMKNVGWQSHASDLVTADRAVRIKYVPIALERIRNMTMFMPQAGEAGIPIEDLQQYCASMMILNTTVMYVLDSLSYKEQKNTEG